MCMCRKKSITYENNNSSKQRLVIVLTLHIECNFGFKVFVFSLPLSPPFIINHPETVNCCKFLFVSTFVGDFGRELSYKRTARLKGEDWDGADFKIGVAATLPELSEWTLLSVMVITKKNCLQIFAASVQVISAMTGNPP